MSIAWVQHMAPRRLHNYKVRNSACCLICRGRFGVYKNGRLYKHNCASRIQRIEELKKLADTIYGRQK